MRTISLSGVHERLIEELKTARFEFMRCRAEIDEKRKTNHYNGEDRSMYYPGLSKADGFELKSKTQEMNRARVSLMISLFELVGVVPGAIEEALRQVLTEGSPWHERIMEDD